MVEYIKSESEKYKIYSSLNGPALKIIKEIYTDEIKLTIFQPLQMLENEDADARTFLLTLVSAFKESPIQFFQDLIHNLAKSFEPTSVEDIIQRSLEAKKIAVFFRHYKITSNLMMSMVRLQSNQRWC